MFQSRPNPPYTIRGDKPVSLKSDKLKSVSAPAYMQTAARAILALGGVDSPVRAFSRLWARRADPPFCRRLKGAYLWLPMANRLSGTTYSLLGAPNDSWGMAFPSPARKQGLNLKRQREFKRAAANKEAPSSAHLPPFSPLPFPPLFSISYPD